MSKLSENQKKEICRLYLQKISTAKLAELFKCCIPTIVKALKENGITPTKAGYKGFNRYSEEKELEIIELYKKE